MSDTEEINIIPERTYSRAEKLKKQKQEPLPEPVTIEFEPAQIPEPTAEPKKRPSRTTPRNTLDKTLESNVRMLLGTAFTLTTSKFGDIWIISEEELKSITEPLTRIMQRMGLTETTNANTDYIMLIGALTVVLLPRIIASFPKKDKKEKQNDIITIPTERANKSNSERPSETISKTLTNKTHLSKLFE